MIGESDGEDIREHYVDMLEKKGILYETKVSQLARFEPVSKFLLGTRGEFSIIDLGCGTGDMLKYMLSEGYDPLPYYGIDVVPELVDEAKKSFESSTEEWQFEVGDEHSMMKLPDCDFVVACGVLGVSVGGAEENWEQLQRVTRMMFEKCKIGIGFDFFLTYTRKPRSTMPLHDPCDVYKWLREEVANQSERVLIDTSYAPHVGMAFAWKEFSAWKKEWRRTGGW